MGSKSTTTTCTPTAVDADAFVKSQSPGAGVIVLNGDLAAAGLGAAQLVRITSGGNDSGITFTVIGTDADGNAQSQTITGANVGNADTTLYFKTVTSITKSDASAGTIVVGNLITSVSPTLKVDTSINPVNIALVAELVSGTSTFDINVTYGDNNTYPALWSDHASIAAKSATTYGSQTIPVAGFRVKMTASSSGVVRLRAVQAGA